MLAPARPIPFSTPLTVLAFFAAAAVPLLVSLVQELYFFGWESVVYFNPVLWIEYGIASFLVTLAAGCIPYLILRTLNRVRWWTTTLWGMAVTAGFSNIMFSDSGPPCAGCFLFVVGLGGAEGLVFWAVWRLIQKKKPSLRQTWVCMVLLAAVIGGGLYWYSHLSPCELGYDRLSEIDDACLKARHAHLFHRLP